MMRTMSGTLTIIMTLALKFVFGACEKPNRGILKMLKTILLVVLKGNEMKIIQIVIFFTFTRFFPQNVCSVQQLL